MFFSVRILGLLEITEWEPCSRHAATPWFLISVDS